MGQQTMGVREGRLASRFARESREFVAVELAVDMQAATRDQRLADREGRLAVDLDGQAARAGAAERGDDRHAPSAGSREAGHDEAAPDSADGVSALASAAGPGAAASG